MLTDLLGGLTDYCDSEITVVMSWSILQQQQNGKKAAEMGQAEVSRETETENLLDLL